MINRIRNNAFIKVFWGLMGLYLLNVSVDTADPDPEHIPEDLSFNDQESIVEIVVEQVLGYENAIKEYDDHDNNDQNKKKNGKIDCVMQISKTNYYSYIHINSRKNPYYNYEPKLTIGFNEIDGPPPKI